MECRYSVEVLQVKSLSLLVKNDGSYILHLLLMYCGLWVCDVADRGIEGVHSVRFQEGPWVKREFRTT